MSKFAKDNNLPNPIHYIDDGYTGTNFNRPSFKKMLADIEDGLVTTVVVKDMSRLGREYLQVGYYTEQYFPDKDIRFIAINDGVDSITGDDDMAPFRNVMKNKGCLGKVICCFSLFRHISAGQPHRLCVPRMGK